MKKRLGRGLADELSMRIACTTTFPGVGLVAAWGWSEACRHEYALTLCMKCYFPRVGRTEIKIPVLRILGRRGGGWSEVDISVRKTHELLRVLHHYVDIKLAIKPKVA